MRRRTSSLAAITMCPSASALAAPPMSFFMISMPLAGLMSRPPVSKAMPLPTSVICRSPARPLATPGEVDEARRARAGAADGMDQGEILRQQVVADDARHVGAVRPGELPGGILQLLRPHVARGRVDEVAAEPDRLDLGKRAGVIDAARGLQLARRRRRRPTCSAGSGRRRAPRRRPRARARQGRRPGDSSRAAAGSAAGPRPAPASPWDRPRAPRRARARRRRARRRAPAAAHACARRP